MSQRNIDFGSFPNDPSADAIRTAFEKVQKNFEELYAGQEAQAVLSVNKTVGAGITVNSPTGDVVVSAKIAQVQIQSTTLGLGTGSGSADAQSAIITSGVTPILIEIPSTVTNVANIVLTNTLTANFVIANANISANNMAVTSNISSGNISTGNIFISANANAARINATNGTFTANVSAVNYTGSNVTLTGNLTASSGNVNAARASFTGNLTAGNASLGNYVVANYFQGDGSLLTGVISVANSQILLGTSNVRILTTNGNVNTSVGGVANVFVVTTTGANVAGTLNATGNANVGNLGTASITATGNITGGNLIGTFANGTTNVVLTTTAANVSVNGTVNVLSVANTGVTVTGIASVTGNANVGNLGTAGLITATGNINAGNLNTAGKVTGSTLVSNVASGTAPISVTSNTLVPTLYVSRANVSDAGTVTTTATGVFYPTFVGANTTANYALASNAAFSANLANGAMIATTFVGNLSGLASTATTAGAVTTNAQPNITSVGTLSNLSVTGNTTSGNFVGVFANGTTNVSIPVAGNAVVFNIGATANVLNVNATGVNVSGTFNTGTGNANVGNLGFGAGQVTGTGNITAGNFIGAIAAGANTITTTGNANVGNLGFGAGQVTGTGNITAGNFIGAIAAGSNAITTTGNITAGNLVGPHANGTSNINIPVASGNVNVSVAGVANVVSVSGTGVNVTGTLNTGAGNANLGNLGFGTGQIIGTGNITAGNLIGAIAAGSNSIVTTGTANVGTLGVTGNITADNVNTTRVTASTLVSNVATGTAPLTVTSTTRVTNLNVSYANVSDFGRVTSTATGIVYPTFATGSATSNYALVSNSAFSANLANGFFGATTLGGTLTTAAQPNVTSVGNLTALTVNGNITSGNANLGNVATANFFIGNGSQLTGITVSAGSFILNGTSNVNIPTTNGNVTTSVNGVANVFTVTSAGAAVNGNLSASNITGVGIVSASSFIGSIDTSAQPNITSVGNLTTLTMAGVANLGPVSNVKINGGVNNQFLITDGAGNLNWITPTTLTVAPGANTQVLFNDGGNFGANALFTFNKVSGNANIGNIGATNGVFTTVTGTLSTAAQPNITSVGTLTSLIVSGTSSLNTVSAKSASINAGTVTSASPALNVVQEWSNASAAFTSISASITDTSSLASSKLMDLIVSGLSKFAIDKAGNVTFSGIAFGDGSGLSSIAGASIVGSLPTSVSNTISNVGNVTVGTWNSLVGSSATFAAGLNGANLSSITGSNVTGWVANANVANYTVVNSQSTGIYYPTFISGNTSANYISASNVAFSANLANGALIATTFVGNIASTGNSTVGNISATGEIVASTNITGSRLISTVASGIAPFLVSSTTVVNNLNSTYVGGLRPNVSAVSDTIVARDTNANIIANNIIGTFANGTSNIAIPTASGNVTVSTNGSEKFRVATDGNIGIGVTTPNNKLDIGVATGVANSGIILSSGGSRLAQFAIANAGTSNDTSLGTITNNSLQILTGGIERMRVMNTGNVGIGNSAPTNNLSVTGTVYVSGNANIGNVGATNFVATGNVSASNLISTLLTGTLTTAAQPNITSVSSSFGNLTFAANSDIQMSGADSFLSGANLVSANFISGNGVLLTGLNASNISTGTLAQARLANSSLTVNGTAISLGASATITANTTQALTLGSYLTGTSFNGGTAVTAAVDATTTNTASKVVARDASGNFAANVITATLSGSATSAATAATAATVTSNSQSNITSVGTLTSLNVNGAVNLATTSGNVGIGTSTPGAGLQVNASSASDKPIVWLSSPALSVSNLPTTPQEFLRLSWKEGGQDLGTGEGSAISFAASLAGDTDYYPVGQIASYKETGADSSRTSALIFGTSDDGTVAPTEKMRINAVGNVGIGTTSPIAALDVYKSSGYNDIRARSGSTSAFIAADTSSVTMGTYNNVPMLLSTNNTERMRVDADGNVGIANTNPSHTLAVTGNAYVSGTVTATSFAGSGASLTTLNATNISSGTLAQARLANSSVTVNGTAISLGASATITANTTQALTLGTYLIGTSFNGGTAVSTDVDATTTASASKIVARDANANVAANYFIGNGSQLTGIITSVSNVTNGTSNVNIPTSGGNVLISVGGTANVGLFRTTGANITGTFGVTGNANIGNVGATAFYGSGAGLTSIPGANVTGTVPTANNSTYLGGSAASYYTDIPARLGFTPVQQGGGTGQGTNKLYMGWLGTTLGIQVDSTNFASSWPISVTGSAASANSVSWTNVSGRPTDLNQFNNGPGYITNSVTGDITLTGELNMVSGSTTARYIDHRGDLYMRYSDNSTFYNNRLLVGGATNYVHVYGYMEAEGNVVAYSSDSRLKTNVTPISDALGKIDQIGGYTFDWDMEKCDEVGFTPGNVHEHGVIAQEIEAIMPDVTAHAPFDRQTNADGTVTSKSGEYYKTVSYDKIVPLLIQAIKELKAEVAELKGKMT